MTWLIQQHNSDLFSKKLTVPVEIWTFEENNLTNTLSRYFAPKTEILIAFRIKLKVQYERDFLLCSTFWFNRALAKEMLNRFCLSLLIGSKKLPMDIRGYLFFDVRMNKWWKKIEEAALLFYLNIKLKTRKMFYLHPTFFVIYNKDFHFLKEQ